MSPQRHGSPGRIAGALLLLVAIVAIAAAVAWRLHAAKPTNTADRYLQRLMEGNLEFRDAVIEYRSGTNQRWYSFTAQGSNVLIRSAVSPVKLREQKFFLTQDDQLQCRTGGSFWRYHSEGGGFVETDRASILDPKTANSGARATEVRFSSQTRDGELLWLGIPDYWSNGTHSNSNGLRWSGELVWRGNEPFISTLSISGNVLTNLIELPRVQDRYRKQLRVVRFGTKSDWPESMEAYTVTPSGTWEPMFTLKLHSIESFRPRDVASFLMTNHVVNNSIAITSLKNGVQTRVDVRDKPWNFVLVQGVPVPFFALWTLGIVVAITAAIIVIPMLAGDGNEK